MNFFPIKVAVAFLMLFILSFFLYYNYALDEAKTEVYKKTSQRLIKNLNYEKQLLKNIGLINAISVAENSNLQKAVFEHDRNKAIKILESISQKFKERTKIKELKIHIHTKDTKSFIRNWKLSKYGDDLSGFRKSIVTLKVDKKLVFGFEIGRIGLTLRSIVPMSYKNEFIGSLEFIQNFDNVVSKFNVKGNNYLLLMDDSLLEIATYLEKAPKVSDMVVSLKKYDEEFLKLSQKVDIQKLKKDTYLLTDEYLFSYEYITDISNKKVGMHLLATPIEQVNTSINERKKHLLYIGTISFAFFVLFGIIAWLVLSSRRS